MKLEIPRHWMAVITIAFRLPYSVGVWYTFRTIECFIGTGYLVGEINMVNSSWDLSIS